jgi:hypothetical protein
LIASEGEFNSSDIFSNRIIRQSSASSLREGIRMSIDLQKSIIAHASAALVQRKIMCPGPFRYAILDQVPASGILSQPLSMIKLACLTMDAYHVQQQRQQKPFVLCCFNSVRKTYVVVGIPAGQSLKEVYKKYGDSSFLS